MSIVPLLLHSCWFGARSVGSTENLHSILLLQLRFARRLRRVIWSRFCSALFRRRRRRFTRLIQHYHAEIARSASDWRIGLCSVSCLRIETLSIKEVACRAVLVLPSSVENSASKAQNALNSTAEIVAQGVGICFLLRSRSPPSISSPRRWRRGCEDFLACGVDKQGDMLQILCLFSKVLGTQNFLQRSGDTTPDSEQSEI